MSGRLSLFRADPVLGNPRAPLVLVYGPPAIVPDLAAAARSHRGVEAVTEAGNGLGWLTAWEPAGGASLVPPEGFQIPVEILSVDAESYGLFLPEAQRGAFETLDEGNALLGRSSAALRGIDSTGTLAFADIEIPVAGVVDDELVASHELVVSHETAARLGIDNRKYVLVALGPGLGPEELVEQLRAEFPESTISFREPGQSEYFRPGGETLPQVEIKQFVGEFAARPEGGGRLRIDPEWILSNTVNESIPLLGAARCHRRVMSQVQGAFEQIAEQGLGSLVAEEDFGGCFSPRLLSADPHSGISRHAWGIAFDFNVSNNRYGEPPSMDPRLVEILEDWGFTWGGRWRVPDGMHFELLEPAGASE